MMMRSSGLPQWISNTASPLLKLNLITNHNCNLKCEYCRSKEIAGGYLSIYEIWDLLEAYAALGLKQVNIIGGEPSLREDLSEIVLAAQNNGLCVVLHSNGTLLKSYTPLLMTNVDVLVTCLNGKPDVHNAIRGKGTYHRVVRAMEMFRQHGKKVVIDFIITRRNANLEQLEHALEVAASLGARVNVQPVFDHRLVQADACFINQLKTDEAQSARLFHYLKNDADPELLFNSTQYFDLCLSERSLPQCWMGIHCFCVNPRGYLSNCYHFASDDDPKLNALAIGWAEALQRLNRKSCNCCLYSAHIEDNLHFEEFYQNMR